MKCLSVMQPWASLILHGHKQYETRTWATGHRGWLALHACRSESREAVWLTQSPLSLDLPRPFYRFGADLPRGVLLGVVELEDCVPTSALLNLTTRERVFGDFRPGRFASRLARPRLLDEPIPFPGRQGVFEIPDVPELLALLPARATPA